MYWWGVLNGRNKIGRVLYPILICLRRDAKFRPTLINNRAKYKLLPHRIRPAKVPDTPRGHVGVFVLGMHGARTARTSA